MGLPILQGRPLFIHVTSINMYLLFAKRHNIHMKCHRYYIGVKIFNYILEMDIDKFLTKILYFWFWGFGCLYDAQTPIPGAELDIKASRSQIECVKK